MICRRCGCEFDARRYRRADDSVRCPSCGAVYRRDARRAASPRQGAIQTVPVARGAGASVRRGRKQSFFARRLWKLPVWAWAAILVAVLIIGAGAGRDEPAEIQTAVTSQSASDAAVAAAPAAAQPEANQISLGLTADFGRSRVEVVGATIRSVGSEKYVICEYNWTNNTGKNSMFLAEISEQAFQNGIALDMDYSLYDVETNLATEVMSGYSLTVRTVYKLTAPTEEIVFSVKPLLDLEGAYKPLTFTVNPT